MAGVKEKPHQLVASDRVEGTAVRRPNGERIGHIERLMIDKVSGKVLRDPQFRRLSWHGNQFASAALARLTCSSNLEACQLAIDDDELRRAPSFRAAKDFDWGDRSKAAELHQYCGNPPYRSGF